MKYKDDGSEWYNYFQIRRNDLKGYYIAWIGTTRMASPKGWTTFDECRDWMISTNWRTLVDEEFEREFLE